MLAHAGQRMQNVFTNPARRMQLLLGISLLLALALLVSFAWTAITGYRQDIDQRLEIRSLEYRNLRQLIAGRDEYARQVQEVLTMEDRLVRERLVKAASPPLSEAMLQNIINDLAGETGVNVASMRMLPRVDRDGILLMRLAISARADISAVKNFVLAVETNPRLIFFDELEIRQISQNERRFYHFNAHLAAVTK